MHLNPYGQDAVRLIVDLVNDRPRSLPELVRRCAAAGLVIDMPVGDPDLAVALELVDRWCEVADATEPARRAALVNRLLATASAYPRLTDHGGTGWHLHYRDDGVSLGSVLRALVSVGTALHLAGRGMDRLGRCAGNDCEIVYVDTSRGGRQRYCSPRCANRDAVRRHRATARAEPRPAAGSRTPASGR